MYVTAILDDEQAGKLTYIQQQTNQGVEEIISKALDLYYEKVKSEAATLAMQSSPSSDKTPLEIFQELGLVGCIKDVDPDLSTNDQLQSNNR